MKRQHEITWSAVRTTDATVEPITVAEAKAQAHVEIDGDDSWFTDQITAARRYAEDVALCRTLTTTTWKWVADEFPDEILLPYPPLLTVASVKYYNTDGVLTTLTVNTDYTIDIVSEPGRIRPAYGKVWPTARAMMNAVEVSYTAGYGATAASVPMSIRHGIRLIVAHWYEKREETISGTIIAKVPMAAEDLLAGLAAKRFD